MPKRRKTNVAPAASASSPTKKRRGRNPDEEEAVNQTAEIIQNMTSAFEDDMANYFAAEESEGTQTEDNAGEAVADEPAEPPATREVVPSAEEQLSNHVFFDARGPPRSIIGLVSVLNNVVTAKLTNEPPEVQEPKTLARINLTELVLRGSRIGFRLNTKRFSAATVSCFEPNCCVMISGDGKVLCAGCANIDDAKFAIETIVEEIRPLSPMYGKLRMFDAAVRNMVGTTCFPHQIDVQRLMQDNPGFVRMKIANGVKIPPPPDLDAANTNADEQAADAAAEAAAPVGARKAGRKRKPVVLRKKRSSGITLVYESGYLLVIGARSVEDMIKTYHYVYPIVSNYFMGTAEHSFSADNIRRYYISLREASKNSQASPKSFIAIREDGTRGTVEEWRESHEVDANIRSYKLLTQNPQSAMRNRIEYHGRGMDSLEYTTTPSSTLMLPAPNGGSSALVPTRSEVMQYAPRSGEIIPIGTGFQGAMINSTAARENAMTMYAQSNDARRKFVQDAIIESAMERVYASKALARETESVGAANLVKASKPKGVNVISKDDAPVRK